MNTKMLSNMPARFAARTSLLSVATALAFAATPVYAQEEPADEDAAAQEDENIIVVTGFRASLENAVEEKRNNEQIVESV